MRVEMYDMKASIPDLDPAEKIDVMKHQSMLDCGYGTEGVRNLLGLGFNRLYKTYESELDVLDPDDLRSFLNGLDLSVMRNYYVYYLGDRRGILKTELYV